MMQKNLYWSVYKNLEREVLELSNQIHFDEQQLQVYSVKIAELLIRCSIEIESLAKELYEQEGGNMNPTDDKGNNRDLFFDTDCLALLESKWELSKKQVLVSAANFYFTNEENTVLTPLHKAHKRGTSGADWKKAYQSIKHNRSRSLSQGNVKNLIRGMAALYLLNIYYKDERVTLSKGEFGASNSKNFDTSRSSDIFAIKMSFVAFPSVKYNIDSDRQFNPTDYTSCVYLQIADENTCEREWERVAVNTQRITNEIIEMISKKEISPDFSKKPLLSQLAKEVGGEQFGHKVARDTMPRIYDIVPVAVLNKNQMLYTN